MPELKQIIDVLAISAGLPLAAFIYYYGTVPVAGHKHLRRYSNRWRSTSIGKTLMYQKLSWLAFLIFHLVGVFSDPYPLEQPVRFVMYACLITLFWRVFFNLRKLQKTPLKCNPDDEDEAKEGVHSAAGSETQENPVIFDARPVDESHKN